MKTLVALALLIAIPAATVLAADQPDPLVKRHLDSKKTPYTVDDDNDFAINVDLGNGRTQQVFVISDTNEVDSIRVREIWSIGYRAENGDVIPEAVANRLLEQSHLAILGSWVKQSGGHGVYVIKVPANASANDLDSAIDTCASSADKLEREFTGDKDEF